MAHVQKRGPKRWVARWEDPDGRERAKSFDRKADAEKHLVAVQHQMYSGAYVDPDAGKVTFGAYAEQWRKAQPHRASTARTVEKHLKHALPTFEKRSLSSIKTSDVQAWVTGLSATLAPSTTRAVFERVRTIFRAAVGDKVLASNPCDGVKLPSVPKAKVQPLPREQVRALIDAFETRNGQGDLVHDRFRALIILAAGTGLRAGELFGVKVTDVDFLRRTLTVERQLLEVSGKLIVGPPKTQSSHRTIPLPSSVVTALAEHVRKYPPHADGWLFTAIEGGPIRRTNFMRTYWNPAARAAGIPSGTALHALRHFYASVLIGGGQSVKVVSERLGHTNAAMTLNVYSHLWPDDEDATRRVVDDVLRPQTDARRTGTNA